MAELLEEELHSKSPPKSLSERFYGDLSNDENLFAFGGNFVELSETEMWEHIVEPLSGVDTRHLPPTFVDKERAMEQLQRNARDKVDEVKARKAKYRQEMLEKGHKAHLRIKSIAESVQSRHNNDHPKEHWPHKDAHDVRLELK